MSDQILHFIIYFQFLFSPTLSVSGVRLGQASLKKKAFELLSPLSQ